VNRLSSAIEVLRKDLPRYARTCLTIRDKDARFHRLELNNAQRIAHHDISEQLKSTGRVRAIILKARQEGMSTYVAARFFRRIHLWRGIVAMIVSDTLARAGILWKIYDRYRQNLPADLQPVKKSTQADAKIVFGHDSELMVRPSSDTEAGRSATIHCLHLSELAYWGTGLRETWISLMQSVPPDSGEVIVESTAKGAGGLFHELWKLAEEGNSGWIAIFIPWWIHEEYDAKPGWDPALEAEIRERPDDFEQQAMGVGFSYRGEKHTLGISRLVWRRMYIAERFKTDPFKPGQDAVRGFQQEFPATAEEAFLISGACFFDEERLREMARGGEDPVFRGRLEKKHRPKPGDLSRDESIVAPISNTRGNLRIWEVPDVDKHYVIGVDTAEGIQKSPATEAFDLFDEEKMGGRDKSVAVVLRLPYWEGEEGGEKTFRPLAVAAILAGQIAPEVFAGQLNLLGDYYACGNPKSRFDRRVAKVGVERSHSSGQTVLRLLNEHYKYANLHWAREQLNKRSKEFTRRAGWVTDETTRMPMLDELAQVVREGRINIWSKQALDEMVTFIVWPNGKPMAEEGCHDDIVMALGIALQMVREHFHAETGKIPHQESINYLVGM
jgi:hypothetical protein